MARTLLPPQNRFLREFLQRGVDTEQPRTSHVAELHEFEDCRYRLERLKEAPDVLSASFAHSHQLPPLAEAALCAEYEGVAALSIEPEEGYQLTLLVSAQTLRGLPEPRRAAVLDKLAAVRLYAVGATLRKLLRALAACGLEATPPQAVHARPSAPFFVRPEGDTLTALFPVQQREGREGALAAAFVQEFAEARRTAACADAPRCLYTHPGQPPPFPLDDAAAQAGSSGGYLALIIQPRHVATAERVDAVAWALLTLYAHIDVHVKRFKGFVHSQLLQRTDAMLAVLERAAFAAGEPKARKTATGRTFVEQAAPVE